MSFYTSALVPKRLELLRELRPQAGTIVFLVNPTNPVSAGDIEDMEEAARRVLSLPRLCRCGRCQGRMTRHH
jgi:hypothetical protein